MPALGEPTECDPSASASASAGRRVFHVHLWADESHECESIHPITLQSSRSQQMAWHQRATLAQRAPAKQACLQMTSVGIWDRAQQSPRLRRWVASATAGGPWATQGGCWLLCDAAASARLGPAVAPVTGIASPHPSGNPGMRSPYQAPPIRCPCLYDADCSQHDRVQLRVVLVATNGLSDGMAWAMEDPDCLMPLQCSATRTQAGTSPAEWRANTPIETSMSCARCQIMQVKVSPARRGPAVVGDACRAATPGAR